MEGQFELIERNERDSELLRGSRDRHRDQQPRQCANEKKDNNQRPRNNTQGRSGKYCGFCKRNNHNGTECFRDPTSPAYRPRNNGGGQPQPNRNQPGRNLGGGDNRSGYNRYNSNASMAAMQEKISDMAAMVKALKRRQDDECAAAQFYDTSPQDTMASMVETTAMMPEADPRMEVEVQIGSVRLTAFLDTGCTNSAIDQQMLDTLQHDVVLECETAYFRKADNTIGQTTHRATATMKLLGFSNTRTCSHSFRVAKTLLYPVMLGKDFMWHQKMVIDFDDCTLKWDGIEIKMPTSRKVENRAAAAIAADMECRAEIAIDESEEEPRRNLIATRRLSEEQMTTILHLLDKFPVLFSGKLGTFRKEPYVIPFWPDAETYAGRPFPIPLAERRSNG